MVTNRLNLDVTNNGVVILDMDFHYNSQHGFHKNSTYNLLNQNMKYHILITFWI